MLLASLFGIHSKGTVAKFWSYYCQNAFFVCVSVSVSVSVHVSVCACVYVSVSACVCMMYMGFCDDNFQ